MWLYLDISPLFSHIVKKLVQAFLTVYHEVFQALAVDGGVLFSKPLLDLGYDSIVRWKLPMPRNVFPVWQTRDSRRGPSRRSTVCGKHVPSCPAWQQWWSTMWPRPRTVPRHHGRTCWTDVTSAPHTATICLWIFRVATRSVDPPFSSCLPPSGANTYQCMIKQQLAAVDSWE